MTTATGEGLRVAGLRVAYGGKVAVGGATLAAPVGRITGLIGPNGAGKTTILNACNGLLKPQAGTIAAFGVDVTAAGTPARARAGLGRTFQVPEVCAAMTVRQNVALGLEARLAGPNPFRQLASSPGRQRVVAARTAEAMHTCGIAELARQDAGTLTTGQRRRLELARALAGGYELLLLDEPSSGLDDQETEELGSILRQVVADGQRGVLLVEHDMSLVMSVCDNIYVLEFGEVVFEGTPAEVQASDVVRAAYLGTWDAPGLGR